MYVTGPFIAIGNWHRISKRNDTLGNEMSLICKPHRYSHMLLTPCAPLSCSGCDSLFPSLMLLEHHKEEFEHWSDEEIGRRVCCRRNRCDDDYFTDTDSYISDAESEDLERLL